MDHFRYKNMNSASQSEGNGDSEGTKSDNIDFYGVYLWICIAAYSSLFATFYVALTGFSSGSLLPSLLVNFTSFVYVWVVAFYSGISRAEHTLFKDPHQNIRESIKALALRLIPTDPMIEDYRRCFKKGGFLRRLCTMIYSILPASVIIVFIIILLTKLLTQKDLDLPFYILSSSLMLMASIPIQGRVLLSALEVFKAILISLFDLTKYLLTSLYVRLLSVVNLFADIFSPLLNIFVRLYRSAELFLKTFIARMKSIFSKYKD